MTQEQLMQRHFLTLMLTGSPVTFTVTVASKTTAHPYYGDESSNMYLLDGVAGPHLYLVDLMQRQQTLNISISLIKRQFK